MLILTTFDLDEYVYEALRAGASGFLLKSAPPAELVAAVRAAVAGDALLAPEITRRLIESYVRRPPPGTDTARRARALTPREREVFAPIARGARTRRSPQLLYVTEATVKTHVSRILTKLGVATASRPSSSPTSRASWRPPRARNRDRTRPPQPAVAGKKELVHRQTWPTRPELISEVFDYVEGFYNTTRRHSTLGYLSLECPRFGGHSWARFLPFLVDGDGLLLVLDWREVAEGRVPSVAVIERLDVANSAKRRSARVGNGPSRRMSSFFSVAKARSPTRADLHLALFVELVYNRHRRHSTLGYLSPIEYEKKTISIDEEVKPSPPSVHRNGALQ